MQFYTESLVNIINQLSQNGFANGYLKTLGLVLQLIGLLIIPIAFAILGVIILACGPAFIANKFVTKEVLAATTKILIYKKKKNSLYLDFNEDFDSDKADSMRKRINLVYIITSCIIAIISVILLSPFLFASTNETIRVFLILIIFIVAASPLIRLVCLEDICVGGHVIGCYKISSTKSYDELYVEVDHYFDKLINSDTNYKAKELKKKLEEAFGDRVGTIEIRK